MVWWSPAQRRNTMPSSLVSDTLKPMTSVQKRVERSMLVTRYTTCPIFLTWMGVLTRPVGRVSGASLVSMGGIYLRMSMRTTASLAT
jgi:hypothetical protein